ncbi:MAG: hypothetical protein COA78_10575 [Blastopirellula sp.]|nr:MAG: hypothetical protein COA78_10575 [Blastopirellula sp.]
MNDINPYSSPQIEPEQIESELGVAERSSTVHLVAVLNLILGTLGLVYSGTSLFWVVSIVIRYGLSPLGGYSLWLVIGVIVLFVFIPSSCLLLAGLGILYRQQWGRSISFALASLGVLFAIVTWGLGIGMIMANHTIGAVFVLLLGLILAIYPIMVFTILRSKKYKAEFS